MSDQLTIELHWADWTIWPIWERRETETGTMWWLEVGPLSVSRYERKPEPPPVPTAKRVRKR